MQHTVSTHDPGYPGNDPQSIERTPAEWAERIDQYGGVCVTGKFNVGGDRNTEGPGYRNNEFRMYVVRGDSYTPEPGLYPELGAKFGQFRQAYYEHIDTSGPHANYLAAQASEDGSGIWFCYAQALAGEYTVDARAANVPLLSYFWLPAADAKQLAANVMGNPDVLEGTFQQTHGSFLRQTDGFARRQTQELRVTDLDNDHPLPTSLSSRRRLIDTPDQTVHYSRPVGEVA